MITDEERGSKGVSMGANKKKERKVKKEKDRIDAQKGLKNTLAP